MSDSSDRMEKCDRCGTAPAPRPGPLCADCDDHLDARHGRLTTSDYQALHTTAINRRRRGKVN